MAWTWGQHRIVPTQQAAVRAMKAWKWWYLRHGWLVHGSQSRSFTAHDPETGQAHACAIHYYDGKTLRRIYPEAKKKPPPKERHLSLVQGIA